MMRNLRTSLIGAIVAAAGFFGALGAAHAACAANVAGDARLWRASLTQAAVKIAYLGHSAARIESPGGIAAAADYFGFDGPFAPPLIATMNNVHSMHWTPTPAAATSFVLHGWRPGPDGGPHDVVVEDMRVRSVSTNTRAGVADTRYGGSSIFVFETAGICIAHLGHLHHPLEPEHLTELGRIDVLLTPADGGWTLSHADAAAVIAQIAPRIVIPVHYMGDWMVERFLAAMPHPSRRHPDPVLEVTFDGLPAATEIVVLPSLSRN